jgi:hypothetical protein
MKVEFILGECTEKARSSCYKYLKKKYLREKSGGGEKHNESNIREGEYGGPSEKRV